MSTFSLLEQLDSGIICLLNAFLRHKMAVSLGLIDTFYLWVFSKQFFLICFIFIFQRLPVGA